MQKKKEKKNLCLTKNARKEILNRSYPRDPLGGSPATLPLDEIRAQFVSFSEKNINSGGGKRGEGWKETKLKRR